MTTNELEGYFKKITTVNPFVRDGTRLEALDNLLSSSRSGISEAMKFLIDIYLKTKNDNYKKIIETYFNNLKNNDEITSFCMNSGELNNIELEKIAIKNNYLPSDDGKKNLFLFVTKQFEQFDLNNQNEINSKFWNEYDNSSNSMKKNTLAIAISNKRSNLIIDNISPGGKYQNGKTIQDFEWEELVTSLKQEKQYDQLKKLVSIATSKWAFKCIQILENNGIKPIDVEKPLWDDLKSYYLPTWNPKDEDFMGKSISTNSYFNHIILPDGKRIVTSGDEISIWSIPELSLIDSKKEEFLIKTFLTSEDEKTIFGICSDNQIRLWNARDWRLLDNIPIDNTLANEFTLSKTGKYLGGYNKDSLKEHNIYIWQLPEGKLIKTIKQPSKIISSIVFSQEEDCIVSLNADKNIHVWDIINGELIKKFFTEKLLIGNGKLSFNSDGNLLIMGIGMNYLSVWDIKNSSPLGKINVGGLGKIRCFSISKDNKFIAVGKSGQIFYDPDELYLIKIQDNIKTLLYKYGNEIYSLAITPDSKYLTGTKWKELFIWSLPI